MCGIVGYVGSRSTVDFLLEGLRRLEYRGYDSSGIATVTPERHIVLSKASGRLESLLHRLDKSTHAGSVGIGHTRWATHGAATPGNAHPHIGGNQVLALVHNGVIENFLPLRAGLERTGYIFRSETDSEVVAHLLSDCLEREIAALPAGRRAGPEQLTAALRATTSQLRGTYGLAVVFRDFPEYLLATRLGSPLVIGMGEGEHFLASDAATLTGYAEQIVYLADHQVALLSAERLELSHRELGVVEPSIEAMPSSHEELSRGGHAHYMLKEIFEQPETVRGACAGV